jgi:hypothetical protein
MGDAKAQFALEGAVVQPGQNLVVQRQHLPRIGQELLPFRGQRQPPRRSEEERSCQRILEPFDLHRHCRLRQVQKRGRTGHAARVSHNSKGPQSRQIQISSHDQIP